MKVTLQEKHELTLRFDSSEELQSFVKKHRDEIVSVTDYKCYTWFIKSNVDTIYQRDEGRKENE